MLVNVTNYYPPNGRKKVLQIEVADECKKNYELLTSLGCILTKEVLSTDAVFLCISHSVGDFDIALTTKDPAIIQTKFEYMILQFDQDAFNAFLEETE